MVAIFGEKPSEPSIEVTRGWRTRRIAAHSSASRSGAPLEVLRQWLTVPPVHQQHVVVDGSGERNIDRVGIWRPGMKSEPVHSTNCASSFGTASSAIVRKATPRQ